VVVLESGTGLPSRCNNTSSCPASQIAASNPFTPDVLIFDQNGNKWRPLGKPTSAAEASGRRFRYRALIRARLAGGRLFATDSNQGARGALGKGNNTSRIVTVNLNTGTVTPVITGLPPATIPPSRSSSICCSIGRKLRDKFGRHRPR